MEGSIEDGTKIRKRGCSPSSSTTSSVIHNHRFKRAILAGKRGRGVGSSTPVPTWRMVGSRSPSVVIRAAGGSPRYPPSLSGRSRTEQGQTWVSARKLGATLWEMNEVPSPCDGLKMKEKEKENRKIETGRRCVNSGSLPRNLSDPSHSPLSERIELSGTGSHQRKVSSLSRRMKIDSFESISDASLMEIETRSRCQTSSGSTVGVRTRLKDVSNALTTSKELLKIINRMWSREDQPSSSMSLMSALHAELERARLQINQLILEERSDHKEINYLLKRFAEEKAAWKNKEQEMVEAAVESIAGELEVEKKLRTRSDSLNKKLGKELAETKESYLKAMKELENEKKARGIVEQVCHELARNIDKDKTKAAKSKRESLRMQEEVAKEREMLHIAEALREERAQMKLLDAKHHFEEKNAAVDKLRNELEAFLRSSNSNENGIGSCYRRRDGDLAFCQNEAKESDAGEVEDATDDSGNSSESDLHSIELNMIDPLKNSKLSYAAMGPRISKKLSVDEELKARKSLVNQVTRRSTSLLRSMSDMAERGNGSHYEIEKPVPRRSWDEMHSFKSVKNLREHSLPNSRLGLDRAFASPCSQRGSLWPSRDPCDITVQRPMSMEGSGMRVRLEEARVDGHSLRRSRR